MPTPKQTRYHYKRCRRAFHRLITVLNEAHNADVINYLDKKNPEVSLPSVCAAVWDAKKRFEDSTHDQLASAMKEELTNEIKGVW